MTGALAIFAKTPGLSPVKTRLAADIGVEKAEQFYRYSVKCLEELALTVLRETQGSLVPYWAVGEENGLNHPLWENFDRLWTGDGGLGHRLNYVYAELLKKHDHVILIGTDSPQLSSGRIIEAHDILMKKAGHAIGPAEDGGYYLYGGHVPLPCDLWLSVPYSVPQTCTVFAEKLQLHGEIHYLTKTFDVDLLVSVPKLVELNESFVIHI
ncbi:MAG: DUF2064 domain-containing protein [Alphaproteobacteria bacterium]